MSHISIASAAPQGTVPHNVESLRVEELIPEQLRQSSEKFIDLIKKYYDHLNSEGLPTYEINRIIDEHDIDKVSEKYLDGIQAEIAKNVPDSRVMDRVSLYKKIIKYYTVKGSQESITTFFRLFFDEIIEVSYPKEKLFKLSDGNWDRNDNKYINTINASLLYGNKNITFNYNKFELKNDDDVVLGTGKIIKGERVSLYDEAPKIQSLVFDINSTKNVNSIIGSWDSLALEEKWRGYFNNGATFNQYDDVVVLDGKKSYVDFGDIGDHAVDLNTDEHSFIIRARPKKSKENTQIQPLFSLAKDYSQVGSHEVFFNKTTRKVGRSFIDNKDPNIILDTDNTSLIFSNFIDSTSLNGESSDYYNRFFADYPSFINGKWVQNTAIFFNDAPIYQFNTDPYLNSEEVPSLPTTGEWTDETYIPTLLYVETDGSKYRWTLQSYGAKLYFTDWVDFADIPNPYDLNLKWNSGYKPGTQEFKVLPTCDALKKNESFIFELHNRGYLSIYHNDIIKQEITFANSDIKDILDYAIEGDYLLILDKELNDNTRVIAYKRDSFNDYVYEKTLNLNGHFSHIKLVKSQIVVGTGISGHQDLRVYDNWEEDNNYKTLKSDDFRSVTPDLEYTDLNISSSPIGNIISNINEEYNWDGNGLAYAEDEGSYVYTKDFTVKKRFTIALRFKVSGVDDNRDLTLFKLGSLSVITNKDGNIAISDGTTDTNNISRYTDGDDQILQTLKHSGWNTLVVDFELGEFDETSNLYDSPTGDVWINSNISINGFRRTVYNLHLGYQLSSPNWINANFNATSTIEVGSNNVEVSYFAIYDGKLTELEHRHIDTYLASSVDVAHDLGRFEVNESGNVIIKASDYGLYIWEKINDEWHSYFNTIEDITDNDSSQIYKNSNLTYSYKFFGDALLLVNGGYNNKIILSEVVWDYDDDVYGFNPATSLDNIRYSGYYKQFEPLTYFSDQNREYELYYIESEYRSTRNSWKVKRKFKPSTVFVQPNTEIDGGNTVEAKFKTGLQYGLDIAIDNSNEYFAISYEPSFYSDNVDTIDGTNDKDLYYDIYKKISDNTIVLIPIEEPIDGWPKIDSFEYNNYELKYKTDTYPTYNAILSYPYLIHSTNTNDSYAEHSLLKYGYSTDNSLYELLDDEVIISDFVVSTPGANEIYLDNSEILPYEYSIVIIRGRANRYNGYVDISVNGTDFERIFSGNTSKTLLVSPESNFVLGRNKRGYFNGDISHAQYYNDAISDSTKDEIVEYLNKNVLDFYALEFDEISGTSIGATKMVSDPLEKDDVFTFNNLDGHIFNSFWVFDQPNLNDNPYPRIRITANYNNAISAAQDIHWGDGNSDLLLDEAAVQHLYTSDFVGKYLDRKGQASSVNRIQDSMFWQEFSYNIRSSLKIDEWEQQFVNLVHPAGLRFFATVLLLVIRDNHWFGPKYVTFDPNSRENINLIKVEDKFLSPFRTTQPIEDLRWLESLTAPTEGGGYHMPIFQPGWLQGDIRVRQFIFEAAQWTKLARFVPGNEATAKYTYEYIEGDPVFDKEIRIIGYSGEELKVGDQVYQDVENITYDGVITKIIPDGDEFTGILRLTNTAIGIDNIPESQREYSLPGPHISSLDDKTYFEPGDGSGNATGNYITLNLFDETYVHGLIVQGGINPDTSFDVTTNEQLLSDDEFTQFGFAEKISGNDISTAVAVRGILKSTGKKGIAIYQFTTSWNQISDVILVDPDNDGSKRFGDELKYSGDGVAIDNYNHNDLEGVIQVYDSTLDNRHGSDIIVPTESEYGYTFDFEKNGNDYNVIVANTAPTNSEYTSIVSSYKYDSTGVIQYFSKYADDLVSTRNDAFGKAVAISGDRIAISSPNYEINKGKIQVFDFHEHTENITVNPEYEDRYHTSVWGYNEDTLYRHSLSKLDSSQGWSCSSAAKSEIDNQDWDTYVELDLGEEKSVAGIITQGRNSEDYKQWVTDYKIEISIDGDNWTYLENPNFYGTISDRWIGNNESNYLTAATNTFDDYVTARYIRIYPTGYQSHPTMRVGAIVGDGESKWIQVGKDIIGDYNNHLGEKIVLDKNVIVTSSNRKTTDGLTTVDTKVYEYNDNSGWIQKGQTLSEHIIEYTFPSDKYNISYKNDYIFGDGYLGIGGLISRDSLLSDNVPQYFSSIYSFDRDENQWIKIGQFNGENITATLTHSSIGAASGDFFTGNSLNSPSEDGYIAYHTATEQSENALGVTGYIDKLNIQYTTDNENWIDISSDSPPEFETGLTDYSGKSKIEFDSPVIATGIRVIPLESPVFLRFGIATESTIGGFVDGDIYTLNSPSTIAAINIAPLKTKTEIIDVGEGEQEAAYAQQDRSTIDINSELFMRAVLMSFKYVIPSFQPHTQFTKSDYQQNLKFKDIGEISSFFNITIDDAIADEFVFTNISAITEKRNPLTTESGNFIYLESDSSPFNRELLIDDIEDWWNNPENSNDISEPVQFNITSSTGPSVNQGDMVYQDITTTMLRKYDSIDEVNIIETGDDDINGTWIKTTDVNGKAAFEKGTDGTIEWDGTKWEIVYDGNTYYESTEDTDYPWEVVSWTITSYGTDAPDFSVNITIGGLITETLDDGDTIMVGWRNAINTSGTDFELPSMPEVDLLFRDGTIYTDYSPQTTLQITVST